MNTPTAKLLMSFLFLLSLVGLASCRDGNSNSGGTIPVAGPNSASLAAASLSDKPALNHSQAAAESRIIFVTESAFTGDLLSLAKKDFSYTGTDPLAAANAICNAQNIQIKLSVPVNDSYNPNIYYIPSSYYGLHRFKALLQGNDATKDGTTYYMVELGSKVTQIGNRSPKYSKDATVGPRIIIMANGTNLDKFSESNLVANLNHSLGESNVSVWTGLTPLASYESDAIGNIPAGMYNYYWKSKTEITGILNISGKHNTNVESSALNQVLFACGTFEISSSSPYQKATSWTSESSVISIPLPTTTELPAERLDIASEGIFGYAKQIQRNSVYLADPVGSGWGSSNSSSNPTTGCAEKRHLYCVDRGIKDSTDYDGD